MIELIYLNESKRIRKEYLENLSFIITKEDEIEGYINRIQQIQLIIDDSNQQNIDKFINEVKELDNNINKINDFITIYHDKIKKLDVDQRLLYNSIKEKYPNIDDEDIKNQILSTIESVNIEFIRRNEQLYKKISNKLN